MLCSIDRGLLAYMQRIHLFDLGNKQVKTGALCQGEGSSMMWIISSYPKGEQLVGGGG